MLLTGEADTSRAGSFTLLFESSLSQDVTQYSQNPTLASKLYCNQADRLQIGATIFLTDLPQPRFF